MPDVLIRNVDQDTIDSLKERAALHGRSLNEELRALLQSHRKLTPAEKVELSRRMVAHTKGGPLKPLAREEFREGVE